MNVFHHLSHRELGFPHHGRNKLSMEFTMDKYQRSSTTFPGARDDPLLAMAMRPSAISGGRSEMLLSAESGIVRLLDPGTSAIRHEWQAHDNAIFDLKWRPGHDQCLTTSGDTSFKLWDMGRVRDRFPSIWEAHPLQPLIHQRSAHLSTIKTVSFMDENIIATGSRDGFIHLWDMRTSSVTHTIAGAHLTTDMSTGCGSGSHRSHTPSSGKKNNHCQPGCSNPIAAVTALLFHPLIQHRLFSSGASDARIKVWDVRMLRPKSTGSKKSEVKCRGRRKTTTIMTEDNTGTDAITVLHTGEASSRHGFSSLCLDPCYNVFAVCSDHRIYSFDGTSGLLRDTYAARGYRTDIFTKIHIFDQFLVSGSVAGPAPVWKTTQHATSLPGYHADVKPIVVLPHEEEVTVIESDAHGIYTLSDDCCINKWSLFAKQDRVIDPASGHRDMRAVPYKEQELDIEIVLPLRPKAAPVVNLTSPVIAGSASAVTPEAKQGRGSPLTTIKDWLTVSNSNIPNSQSQSQSSAHKKRPHSKENSQDASPADHFVTQTPATLKKRIKRESIPSRKISDYFHACHMDE